MTGPSAQRSLVLVAGSGRSGTSLFSGILQRLGFHVPQPEVPADPTNPRGFAESRWVVEFHTRLLAAAGVQVADARPVAWAHTARVCLDADVERALRTWLEGQFRIADDVIVKDPRLSWFLPLWRRCAEDLGAAPRCVTMLRHPAAVIDSKQRWYGARQGEAGRAAGWVNQTLFTERATREARRAFVRYDDLLEDWTRTVARVGDALDLAVVRDAPARALRDVHKFVDHTLSRSRGGWGDARLPAPLQAQADELWRLVDGLAAEPALDGPALDGPASAAALDALRATYVDFYADVEAMAHSSIVAARDPERATGRAAGGLPAPVRWAIARVPEHHRQRVPPHWRASMARALRRDGAASAHS